MDYLAHFFAGAFLCNAVPHLVSGLQGRLFPTPFAQPPGVGLSSPLVNVLWAFFNLLVGAGLLWVFPVALAPTLHFAALMLGALLLSVILAIHFGRVQRQR